MSKEKTQRKRIQSVKGNAVLERLRYVLKQNNMSGRQFAEKIGLKAESATRLFNGVTGLMDDPALVRLTQRVLNSYDDPAYLEELTGFDQTQNPLTTPWNLSWVEHLKRYSEDPRVSKLAKQFQWKLAHTHTGGNPEYWWPEYWK